MSFDVILEPLRRLARRRLLTANTIRYRIEYRAIQNLIRKVDTPFQVLADLGAGSGKMSARLAEEGLARAVVGIEPRSTKFSLTGTSILSTRTI
jgi:predicted RNA methylase